MTDLELAIALKNEYVLLHAKQLGARDAFERHIINMARGVFHRAGISSGDLFQINFDSGTRHFKLHGFAVSYYPDAEIYIIATRVNVDGRLSKNGNERVHCLWKGQIPVDLPTYIEPSTLKLKV